MLIRLWNFLRGYVIIEVSGFSIERFMNLAVHKGIFIWDVHYAASCVVMKISVKGFKMLRDCTRKTKCRIKIVKKVGMPFIIFKNRRRKPLFFGLLFFIFALYFLSGFIWAVQIGGNERIELNELVAYFEEVGFKPGAFKLRLDTKKITNDAMIRFKDISFMSIEVTGTKATVSIVETIPKPQLVDKSTPCDVVAKKTGLIESIITSIGTPLVKEKDVVKEGDTLVSGKLVIAAGEEIKGVEYVHATAKVYAKLWYEVTLTEKIEFIQKEYSGQTKKRYKLYILGKEIAIPGKKIGFSHYDIDTARQQITLGSDYALPIEYSVDEYSEYTPIQKRHTVEELENILVKRLDEAILSELDLDTQIVDIQKSFSTESGEELKLHATITTIERIDVQESFTPEEAEENVQPGGI